MIEDALAHFAKGAIDESQTSVAMIDNQLFSLDENALQDSDGDEPLFKGGEGQ